MQKTKRPKTLPNKFGSVRPLDSGRYQARYTFRSHSDVATLDTESEAWTWLEQAYQRIVDRRQLVPSKRSFAELAAEMLEESDLREGTASEYSQMLEKVLLPHFGAYQISKIEIADVRNFLRKLEKTKAPGTVLKYKSVISGVFTYAIGQQYISPADNPCKYVKVKQSHREEAVFLDEIELLQLANAFEGQNQLAVKILGLGGLRAGELWDLKVNCVDFERQRLQIVRTVRWVKGKGLVSFPAPKNGQWRSVPIPRFLSKEIWAHVADKSPDDYVITSSEGKQIIHTNWHDRHWQTALGASGIAKQPRVHDMRHTCAALYFKQGKSSEEVRKILGNSLDVMTRHYAHIFPEAFDQAVEGVDDLISEALLEQVTP